MKKQSSHRKHNYPDADLHLQVMERLRYAHRDLEYFEQYNFDVERMTKLKALADRFRDLPDDDELVGEQMILSEKKYKASSDLQASIRSLMTRVSLKFNNRSGRYRKFGATKLGDLTDAQLIFCARRVVRVARQQIDFLDDVGVNEKVLSRISDACQIFENAVNLQQDKVADRDIGVERRVDFGNELYDELVVLCNIGKDIWATEDKLKYENFCLYESNNDQKIARKERLVQEVKSEG
ncbi:MAG: hypothetical protein K9J37_05145 [Saprospiraceae bacterium]|nr:hypothetical protein [Saprospiraceae bacterium]MCF8249274.1 hypothetical protein [Saprospiraceae bacterium]MCF8281158.1 hypothetical protein [Bacteroidales bacterium]MCF8311449.1 hypothetical protein [Saprospiraceae bacterium]MCF8439893.1 hypothetical protein [Saprospiraceae bacterium]